MIPRPLLNHFLYLPIRQQCLWGVPPTKILYKPHISLHGQRGKWRDGTANRLEPNGGTERRMEDRPGAESKTYIFQFFCRWNHEPGKSTGGTMIEPNFQEGEIFAVSKLEKIYVDLTPLNDTDLMAQSAF